MSTCAVTADLYRHEAAEAAAEHREIYVENEMLHRLAHMDDAEFSTLIDDIGLWVLTDEGEQFFEPLRLATVDNTDANLLTFADAVVSYIRNQLSETIADEYDRGDF